MVLAVPAGHPLAKLDRPVTDADLKDEPLIMHSPTKARYFYDLVVRMIPIQHANVVHSVSQILTMVSLVAAERGVAFVPHSATVLGVPAVQFLPLESSVNDPVELHAIWNRKYHEPGALPGSAVAGIRGALKGGPVWDPAYPEVRCSKGINSFKKALRQASNGSLGWRRRTSSAVLIRRRHGGPHRG